MSELLKQTKTSSETSLTKAFISDVFVGN
jgi:hypothetical protein